MTSRDAKFAAVFAAACIVTACAKKVDPDTNQPPAALYTVSQDQLARLKITPVDTITWAVAVHTTATVDWDADHTTPVITQVNGPITRIVVDTGARVKANDALLYVASPDLSNAIATYRKAKNDLDLAKRQMDRGKELLDRGAMALKDYEALVAAYNDAATDVQNSLQALKIFGVTKDRIENAERQGVEIQSELALRSPLAGMVVQKLVNPGQLIQAGATTCFLVSDISTVWVQGHIFDRDLPSVHIGDAVEETNPAFNQIFHGTVSYIDALVDPNTRTTLVRIVTRNPSGLLKKDMFVDAVIHTSARNHVLAVPTSAVLHDAQNQTFVYVEVQPGKFGQRLVGLGAQQNDLYEVISGLSAGEKVVSEGSIFIQFANGYQ